MFRNRRFIFRKTVYIYKYGTLCFTCISIHILVGRGMCKVKQSRNRPGVGRVPGGLGSQISWHSSHEAGEVNLTHRPPLPPGMFLVIIFTRGWVDPRAMEQSEVDMSLKNPVTLPGIDPGTVRLLAQRINHYATPGPRRVCKKRWREPRNRPRRTHRVSVGIAQLFLNLDTRRGCVVSITPRPTLPPGKTRYPLYRRLSGPRSRSG
jgi:hypothetical protein